MTATYTFSGGKRRAVTFTVWGVPQPKGSLKAYTPRGWRRPIVTADNTRTRPWQQLIAGQAQAVARDGVFLDAVAMAVDFYLPRPPSLPKRVVHHLTRPDLDKLLRCVKDALTGVLYRDDSQVVRVTARKAYVGYGQSPHAIITVEEVEAVVTTTTLPLEDA